MADIDRGVGRPGSDGPDLGGLDEDILTADLEADLVDDLGDDGLGEDALGDSGESTEDDESEESEDGFSDDDDDGSFLGGTSGSDGPGFSSSPDSFGFEGDGEDSFDFGDAGGGADHTGSLGSPRGESHGRSGPGEGGTSAGAGSAGPKGSSGSSGKSGGDHGGHGGGHGEGGSISPSSVASTSVVTEPFDLPRPSDFTAAPHEKIDGKKTDDDLDGGGGTDVIKGAKGDDDIDGAGGDDWLRGGHGEDVLDGGAGSDVVDGGKGDDTLSYTLGENAGETDFYDGGKGVDTLQINLSADELTQEMWDELQDLREWMAENYDSKSSTGHSFSDASFRSDKHPVYQTSFGLTVRNIEDIEVHVEGYGVVDLDEGLPGISPDPEPEPEPEPAPESEPARSRASGPLLPSHPAE